MPPLKTFPGISTYPSRILGSKCFMLVHACAGVGNDQSIADCICMLLLKSYQHWTGISILFPYNYMLYHIAGNFHKNPVFPP